MIAIFLCLLLGSSAFSASPSQIATSSGGYRLGGNLVATKPSKSTGELSINPDFEYFFFDRFSAGLAGTVVYRDGALSSGFALGPTASYFFWLQESWSASVSQGFRQSFFNDSEFWTSYSRLHLRYFFSSNVALGPELVCAYRFPTRTLKEDSSYGLILSLTVFWDPR